MRALVLGLAVLILAELAGTALYAESTEPKPATKASPAEPPHWPLGFKLPNSMIEGWHAKSKRSVLTSPKADVLVWVPPEAKRLRAVMMIPCNTDSKHIGEHKAVREVAAKNEIGIVYLRHFDGSVIERSDPPAKAEGTFAAFMELLANKTGIAEFRHAPWITLGKSSRGRFPFRTTWWFPKRVIASISYHGETPTWPMAKWSRVKDESVLHLAINGLSEWDGTWYRHVRPCLLNYHRKTKWLAHQLVLYGVDHGWYVDFHGSNGWGHKVPVKQISCLRVWDYIARFMDTAMALRVPKDAYPTEKPTDLLQVKRASGYLIHPRAPEELLGLKWFAFRQGKDGDYKTIAWPQEKTPVYDVKQGNVDRKLLIRLAAEVPEVERRDYMWVPDKEMARAWLKLHNLYGLEKRVLP